MAPTGFLDYIIDFDTDYPSLERIFPPGQFTPYQGIKRSYGLFCCDVCLHSWRSTNSWAQIGQFCRKCYTFNYPFSQRPLLQPMPPNQGIFRPHRPNKTITHRCELCQLCLIYGFSCTVFQYNMFMWNR